MSVDRSQLPVVGADVVVRFPGVRRGTLANGLGLWTVTRPDVPLLTLMLIVPVGSGSDPDAHPGLSALVADLLDEGSGERDAIGIHEALAGLGGQLGTEAGYDSTSVALTTLSRFGREAVRLLTDIVFRPRLDGADFERVRDLRCHRLSQMKDVPGALAERAFVEHLYAGHPYGHLPVGTEAALRRLSEADVRAFHRRHFEPAGTLMIAVGDMAHEAIVAAVEEAFEGLGHGARTEYAQLPPLALGGEPRRLVFVDRPGAAQSELRVGHLAATRASPDYHALVVLNALLGGQFVSRINLNLREEKGFTYGVRSGFDWRRALSPFAVQTSVQTDATAAAVGEILREMRDVGADRPPTDRELALAKASLTRGYARNFETSDQIVRALAQLAIFDLPPTWYDDFVGAVARTDVLETTTAAVRHLRPSEALVVVVGDAAKTADGVMALGFDATRVVGASAPDA